MTIMLIGARGQLGSDLAAVLPSFVPLDHDQFEVTDREQVRWEIGRSRPTVVINTAAYNLVDRAESEPEIAHRVNVTGPENLAIACAEVGAKLVHFSTDFVFGGQNLTRPYREDDPPAPQSVYAQSKWEGEQKVAEFCPHYLIIRTCGLYGRAGTRAKGNFVTTMLKLGAERSEVRVVSDQHCTPTFTTDLAECVVQLLNRDATGLLHITNSGAASWAEFAAEIFRRAKLPTQVVPLTSAEFAAGRTSPTAPRPSSSVLDCGRLASRWGLQLRPWPAALQAFLDLS